MLIHALTLAALADEPAAEAPSAFVPPPAGIGARLKGDVYAGLPGIQLPLPGSPADRAGLRPGDLILTVDGWYTPGHELGEVVTHIGGEPGTEVVLGVQRDGEPFELRVVRAVTRDLVTAQAAAEAELCPALWEAMGDRANNFANVRGEALPEDSSGRTRYAAKTALPTAEYTRVETGLSTYWTAGFGTSAAGAEGERKFDEIVDRFRPCFAEHWLVREVVDGRPVVFFGQEHYHGWYSTLGAFRLRKDGIIDVYVENSEITLFNALSMDAPSGPWVETLKTIAAAAPTNFDSLRGAAHTDGNPFNAARWNDATTSLAGTADCVVYDGGMLDTTSYQCTLARGLDPALIGEFFDKAEKIVGMSLGHDWVYWYDAAPAAHDRRFVHFVKRSTRGFDKTAVVTLRLTETGVTISVAYDGVI